MMSRKMLLGLSVSAALAYFASPKAGRRRRAQVKDQFIRAGQKARDVFTDTRRDLGHRTSGVMAGMQERWNAKPHAVTSR